MNKKMLEMLAGVSLFACAPTLSKDINVPFDHEPGQEITRQHSRSPAVKRVVVIYVNLPSQGKKPYATGRINGFQSDSSLPTTNGALLFSNPARYSLDDVLCYSSDKPAHLSVLQDSMYTFTTLELPVPLPHLDSQTSACKPLLELYREMSKK